MEISVEVQGLGTKRKEIFTDQTVIILDIFRATSFIVTALALGAKRIIPTASINDARRRCQPGQILAGERAAQKIPQFHLGNTPSLLADLPIRKKEIIFTTTNGTKAIAKAHSAAYRLIGSFLNLSACSRLAVRLGRPITLYCAGTRGEFSLEDGVAAGAFVDTCLQMKPSYQSDDLGLLARQSFLTWRRRGWHQLKAGRSGRRLGRLGAEQDLDHCLQLDRFWCVPIVTATGEIELAAE